mmetsp:Transcript_33155/g.72281  ORF Transcript_33155/g.72281 Transcript_33155/m.72281 type:complete len:163 (+) Transcript_33155:154-642(+)
MHKVRRECLPEVHERRVFPFRPSPPPSPSESRSSTPWPIAPPTEAPTRPPRRPVSSQGFSLTVHGLEYVVPRPSKSAEGPRPGRRRSGAASAGAKVHRRHVYSTGHVFGHLQVENDINPFIAHEKLPKWQTTSQSYGVHYRHPEQNYTCASRSRMPVFQIHL